ncbi:MAG: TonB family protein [Gemmatimonadales bacterium]
MFDVLVASRRAGPARGAWGRGLMVVLLHAGLVGAAVWGTRRAAVARPGPIVVSVTPPPSPAGRAPRRVEAPWRAPVIPPVVVPDIVGPPDLEHAVGTPWLPRPGVVPVNVDARFGGDGDDPVPIDLVEQRPELLSAPPPAYPDRLRRLGVEGAVRVRVVVDTTGRVEPTSITVVRVTHADFVGPVREALARALFRPARVHGRAVRVLVEIPFAFRLTLGQ